MRKWVFGSSEVRVLVNFFVGDVSSVDHETFNTTLDYQVHSSPKRKASLGSIPLGVDFLYLAFNCRTLLVAKTQK